MLDPTGGALGLLVCRAIVLDRRREVDSLRGLGSHERRLYTPPSGRRTQPIAGREFGASTSHEPVFCLICAMSSVIFAAAAAPAAAAAGRGARNDSRNGMPLISATPEAASGVSETRLFSGRSCFTGPRQTSTDVTMYLNY
ncbi:hypothetical protein SCUP515_07062 [Seiridium cupressi]